MTQNYFERDLKEKMIQPSQLRHKKQYIIAQNYTPHVKVSMITLFQPFNFLMFL
jgi:hypothetical protein